MKQIENTLIHYNFATGKIKGGSISERIGMELMRVSAFLLAPLEFFGLSKAVTLIKTIFRGNSRIKVELSEDSIFEYPYGDGYWATLLYNRLPYSPEIDKHMETFSDVDYAFIDCGSNFGYMSVLVSSESYGNKPAMAIEADPDNYLMTVRNSENNNNRYEHIHRAIFSESGKHIQLYGDKHEALSLKNYNDTSARAEVKTLAIKDLSKWVEEKNCSKTILKLDVEGVEIEALEGAGEILDMDCLVIYEEHGLDELHTVSDFLINKLDMKLYFGTDHGNKLIEITSLDQIKPLKTSKRIGYDFFATRSDFWQDRFSKIIDRPE